VRLFRNLRKVNVKLIQTLSQAQGDGLQLHGDGFQLQCDGLQF